MIESFLGPLTNGDFLRIACAFDCDKDGTIDYDEFNGAVNSYFLNAASRDHMRAEIGRKKLINYKREKAQQNKIRKMARTFKVSYTSPRDYYGCL